MDQVPEALRMERLTAAVHEAVDTVLGRLGGLFAAQRAQPAGRGFRAREIEACGIEHPVERHPPERCLDDFGHRIERAQDGAHPVELIGRDEVCLVQHQHVAELDLVDQQVDHGAVVVLAQALATLADEVGSLVVVQEVRRIDHGHHRVEPRHVTQAAAVLAAEGEGLGHRQRLGDAGRLDQQVVEPPLAGELRDLDQEVFAQRAADAAIAQLDQLLVGTRQAGTTLAHQLRIDVHLGHVVDDHRDATSVAVVQDMVEQRRLAGAEEAGEDRDRDLFPVARFRHRALSAVRGGKPDGHIPCTGP